MANTINSTTPEALLRSIIDGSLTELEDDTIRTIGRNRLAKFSNLETIYLKKLVDVGSAVQAPMSENPMLKRVNLEAYPGKINESYVTADYMFKASGNSSESVYVFPAIESNRTLPARFLSSVKANIIDFGPGVNKISSYCFATAAGANVAVVNNIILRCPTVVTWTASTAMNTLSGTCFYIPKSLYDHLGDGTANDYRAATNWSSAITSQNFTFAQIEGSAYENYYADGTPVSAS